MAQATTRSALKTQLQEQGLWETFKKAREAHQAAGATPREARQKALLELPSLPYHRSDRPSAEPTGERAGSPAAEATKPEAPPAVQPRRKRKKHRGRIDLRAVIEWVFENLGEPSPRGAPCEGAREMHTWARTNKDEFFKVFVPRLLPTAGRLRDEQQGRAQDDAQANVELAEELLRRLENGTTERPGRKPSLAGRAGEEGPRR
jgi:hypothetical protein